MANGQIENEKNMLPVAGKKLLKFLFVSQESLSGDLALHLSLIHI